MNKETQKFLDVFTDNLLQNKQNNKDFKKNFEDSIKQTANLLSKEELAEIISYILLDFNQAELEMNEEIEKHASKSKDLKP